MIRGNKKDNPGRTFPKTHRAKRGAFVWVFVLGFILWLFIPSVLLSNGDSSQNQPRKEGNPAPTGFPTGVVQNWNANQTQQVAGMNQAANLQESSNVVQSAAAIRPATDQEAVAGLKKDAADQRALGNTITAEILEKKAKALEMKINPSTQSGGILQGTALGAGTATGAQNNPNPTAITPIIPSPAEVEATKKKQDEERTREAAKKATETAKKSALDKRTDLEKTIAEIRATVEKLRKQESQVNPPNLGNLSLDQIASRLAQLKLDKEGAELDYESKEAPYRNNLKSLTDDLTAWQNRVAQTKEEKKDASYWNDYASLLEKQKNVYNEWKTCEEHLASVTKPKLASIAAQTNALTALQQKMQQEEAQRAAQEQTQRAAEETRRSAEETRRAAEETERAQRAQEAKAAQMAEVNTFLAEIHAQAGLLTEALTDQELDQTLTKLHDRIKTTTKDKGHFQEGATPHQLHALARECQATVTEIKTKRAVNAFKQKASDYVGKSSVNVQGMDISPIEDSIKKLSEEKKTSQAKYSEKEDVFTQRFSDLEASLAAWQTNKDKRAQDTAYWNEYANLMNEKVRVYEEWNGVAKEAYDKVTRAKDIDADLAVLEVRKTALRELEAKKIASVDTLQKKVQSALSGWTAKLDGVDKTSNPDEKIKTIQALRNEINDQIGKDVELGKALTEPIKPLSARIDKTEALAVEAKRSAEHDKVMAQVKKLQEETKNAIANKSFNPAEFQTFDLASVEERLKTVAEDRKKILEESTKNIKEAETKITKMTLEYGASLDGLFKELNAKDLADWKQKVDNLPDPIQRSRQWNRYKEITQSYFAILTQWITTEKAKLTKAIDLKNIEAEEALLKERKAALEAATTLKAFQNRAVGSLSVQTAGPNLWGVTWPAVEGAHGYWGASYILNDAGTTPVKVSEFHAESSEKTKTVNTQGPGRYLVEVTPYFIVNGEVISGKVTSHELTIPIPVQTTPAAAIGSAKVDVHDDIVLAAGELEKNGDPIKKADAIKAALNARGELFKDPDQVKAFLGDVKEVIKDEDVSIEMKVEIIKAVGESALRSPGEWAQPQHELYQLLPRSAAEAVLSDVNKDGEVTLEEDLVLAANSLGTNGAWADVDGNGVVEIFDFVIIVNNSGRKVVEELEKVGFGFSIEARLKAVEVLGSINTPQAAEVLVVRLTDNNENVSTLASQMLARKGVLAVKPLIKRLEEEAKTRIRPSIREFAVDIFTEVGAPASEELVTVMEDSRKDIHVRELMAEILGDIGDTRASPALVSVLKTALSENEGVLHRMAAVSLGKIIEKTRDQQTVELAVTPLIDALEDVRFGVAYDATVALEKIAKNTTDKQILEKVTTKLTRSMEAGNKQAFLVLNNIGVKPSAHSLIRFMKATSTDLQELSSPLTHPLAIKALVEIGPSAVNELIAALSEPDWGWAADVLGQIGDKRAVSPLIDVLRNELKKESPNWHMSRSAVSALGKLRDSQAVKPLVEILLDKRALEAKETPLKNLGLLSRFDLLADTISALRTLAETIEEKRALEPALGPLIRLARDKKTSSTISTRASEVVRKIAKTIEVRWPLMEEVGPLIRKLEDKQPNARTHVAKELIEVAQAIGDNRMLNQAVTVLQNVIQDKTLELFARVYAADALAIIATAIEDKELLKPTIGPLMELLMDPNIKGRRQLGVRSIAAQALAIVSELTDNKQVLEKAAMFLISVMGNKENTVNLLAEAGLALEKMIRPLENKQILESAIDPLVSLIGDEETWIRALAQELRDRADMIEEGPLELSFEDTSLLRKIAPNVPPRRNFAAQGLRDIADRIERKQEFQEEIQIISDRLHFWHPYFRFQAVETLGKIAEVTDEKRVLEPGIEPLIKIVKDTEHADQTIRIKTAEVLGAIGDERAVGPLTEMAKDNIETVRSAATQALDKIRARHPEAFAAAGQPEQPNAAPARLSPAYDGAGPVSTEAQGEKSEKKRPDEGWTAGGRKKSLGAKETGTVAEPTEASLGDEEAIKAGKPEEKVDKFKLAEKGTKAKQPDAAFKGAKAGEEGTEKKITAPALLPAADALVETQKIVMEVEDNKRDPNFAYGRVRTLYEESMRTWRNNISPEELAAMMELFFTAMVELAAHKDMAEYNLRDLDSHINKVAFNQDAISYESSAIEKAKSAQGNLAVVLKKRNLVTENPALLDLWRLDLVSSDSATWQNAMVQIKEQQTGAGLLIELIDSPEEAVSEGKKVAATATLGSFDKDQKVKAKLESMAKDPNVPSALRERAQANLYIWEAREEQKIISEAKATLGEMFVDKISKEQSVDALKDEFKRASELADQAIQRYEQESGNPYRKNNKNGNLEVVGASILVLKEIAQKEALDKDAREQIVAKLDALSANSKLPAEVRRRAKIEESAESIVARIQSASDKKKALSEEAKKLAEEFEQLAEMIPEKNKLVEERRKIVDKLIGIGKKTKEIDAELSGALESNERLRNDDEALANPKANVVTRIIKTSVEGGKGEDG